MLWWPEAQSLVLMLYQLQDFAGMGQYDTIGLLLTVPLCCTVLFSFFGSCCIVSFMCKYKPR